ncbi:amidohydrolase family protein [Polymorphobacter fuscus]|uniref:Amidohydrolase family protein n=2 Tax=Sandarakinorhabdus fusca TaxID=1439888 RepID=A0A7C9GSB9_9SPHN|nr:amidohydrolase [Polymorphobacter fuscus]MQT15658.1 amidohydrolase family protein [Polymorphobacter fuscus]
MRCALLVSGLMLGQAALADTAYVNANGYTIDAAGGLARFGTLVVADDGRVKATLAAGAPVPRGKRIDVKGRTLMPGLIDAHGHVMGLGELALKVDLNGTTSLAEAQARLRAYKTGSAWITGGGWNQERWQLGRFPTAAELDAVTGARPAFLERVDGHAGWANSRALALAGVTAATPDPAGGRIERDAAGNPTGVLVDGAMKLVASKIPAPSQRESDAMLAKSLAIMASVGLTGAGDAGIDPATWERYQRFARTGKLTARIYAMAYGPDNRAAIAPQGPIGWNADDRLAMMAMKLQADGALGSRGAWMKAPYSDAPGNRGLPFFDEGALRRIIVDASAKGFQVNVHAIGDAANGAALGAFAVVPAEQRTALRHRDEHAQIVAPDDLPRFARLGIIASIQPTHATSDKGMAEARVGAERLAGGYAWRTLIDSGVRIAAGSDFPVEPPNPFYGLHAAVTRQSRDGQPAGGWRTNEAMTLPEAFAAFTTGAAYAEHAEDKFGTLTPGKWADFIVVDRDPFAIAPATLWQVVVEETFVGGKRVYRRR